MGAGRLSVSQGAPGLAWPHIDWQQPWLRDWRCPGAELYQVIQRGTPVHVALNDRGSAPVRFCDPAELPQELAYESFVSEHRRCPTRDGLHDFFNGLCWLRFPHSKARLNALQAAEIAASGVGASRGPVRDAITVFDENGALLLAPEPLWLALEHRNWSRLFGELRPLWAESRLILFGHALLEKLMQPRKGMTAHVLNWQISANASVDELDQRLAAALQREWLARKPFLPLPVLGVPGWCAANDNPDFYADQKVFRPHDSRPDGRMVCA